MQKSSLSVNFSKKHLMAILVLGMLMTGACFAGGAAPNSGWKVKTHKHCHTHKHLHGYQDKQKKHSHNHCHSHWHPFKNTRHAHKSHTNEFHKKKLLFKNHHKTSKK